MERKQIFTALLVLAVMLAMAWFLDGVRTETEATLAEAALEEAATDTGAAIEETAADPFVEMEKAATLRAGAAVAAEQTETALGAGAVTAEAATETGAALGAGAVTAEAAQASATAEEQQGILRLHVIANSDSEEDQALKLKVRNRVLTQVQSRLARRIGQKVGFSDLTDPKRAELTREYIEQHLEDIEEWAAEEISEAGFDYSVSATLGVTWIPAKTYDDIYFPAGNYEALRIIIGEGKGQNWWCVIFPPLCLIDGGELQQDGFSVSGRNQIILKSKIKELLAKSS